MKLNFYQRVLAVLAAVFLAASVSAADTNGTATVTRDELADNYLRMQEQVHATQLAIEQNQQAALATAQSNANVLAIRLQALEQSIARQHASDTEGVRKTQQLTLLMAGLFGVIGLGILLMMVYFQWRAFTQLAQISTRQHAALANSDAVHQLAAPGRATVETSNVQLLNVVNRLEQRIHELEGGQKLLPEAANAKSGDLLAEGQKYLDANLPQKALEYFDQDLMNHPNRPEAMARRAMALEKLGRDEEALDFYNRAIAADNSLVLAHLHKGGLLNRLRRYDEALNCYEQALAGQEKRGTDKTLG